MEDITKINYKGYSIQFRNNHTALIYEGETLIKGIASGHLHGDSSSLEKSKKYINENLIES